MSGKRYGTYAVMAWLAELDLTVMWGGGRASASASTSRAILQTIANFVDASNSAYPGVEKIAAHCDNLNERTIRRHLKRARQVGLITVDRKNLGYRRGKDVITFNLSVTQEQLDVAADDNPHRVKTWIDDEGESTAVPASEDLGEQSLQAEIAILKERLAKMESAAGATQPDMKSGWEDSAEKPQSDMKSGWEDSADSGLESPGARVEHEDAKVRFRSGHEGPIPTEVTTPDNHSSSSSGEPAADGGESAEDEEEDLDSLVAEQLIRVHPKLELGVIRDRVVAAGIDLAQIDVVAAATEVIASRAGSRIGSPSAYVATSIVRERWRWARSARQSWDELVADATPATPGCADGVHRWVRTADGDAFCGPCGALKSRLVDDGQRKGGAAA